MQRQINDLGLNLIKSSEGLRLQVYLDAVKKPTVGYGHLLTQQDNLHLGDSITSEQADALLRFDLTRTEEGVEQLVTIDITDNQFSALVSFAFNLGLHSLKTSTLLRKLNNSDDINEVAEEFLKWDFAGGHRLVGLTIRRRKEKELFLL